MTYVYLIYKKNLKTNIYYSEILIDYKKPGGNSTELSSMFKSTSSNWRYAITIWFNDM